MKTVQVHLGKLFKLAKNDTVVIDMAYNHWVYELQIRPLHKKVKRNYPANPKNRSIPVRVYFDKCPYCHKLMVNGVCLYSCEASSELEKKGIGFPMEATIHRPLQSKKKD